MQKPKTRWIYSSVADHFFTLINVHPIMTITIMKMC